MRKNGKSIPLQERKSQRTYVSPRQDRKKQLTDSMAARAKKRSDNIATRQERRQDKHKGGKSKKSRPGFEGKSFGKGKHAKKS